MVIAFSPTGVSKPMGQSSCPGSLDRASATASTSSDLISLNALDVVTRSRREYRSVYSSLLGLRNIPHCNPSNFHSHRTNSSASLSLRPLSLSSARKISATGLSSVRPRSPLHSGQRGTTALSGFTFSLLVQSKPAFWGQVTPLRRPSAYSMSHFGKKCSFVMRGLARSQPRQRSFRVRFPRRRIFCALRRS